MGNYGKTTVVIIMDIQSTVELQTEIFGYFGQKAFPGIIPGHYIVHPVHLMVIEDIPPNTSGALFRVNAENSAPANIALVKEIMQKLNGNRPWVIVWDDMKIPWPIDIQFENSEKRIHVCRTIFEIGEKIIALQPAIALA